jgi:hypothetical protein
LAADFIFDTGGESIVELTAESTVTPATDLGGKSLEFYNVLIDALSIAHVELLEVHLCIPGWVMGSEVSLEF